jgi:Fe-S-cluster containining protein
VSTTTYAPLPVLPLPGAEHGADGPVARLERQVERGGLFTHTALSAGAERTAQLEAVVYGLVDLLVTRGVATSDEVAAAARAVRDELAGRGETAGPGVALRVDAPAGERDDGFVPVNCAERMHVCQAVCCRLSFALSAPEVEAGRVRWDLGQPYRIRHEADGRCTHLDPERRRCGVYDDRPGVCRGYSCARDERIWKDFDGMELNHEWIAAHLGAGTRPRLAHALMHRLDGSAPAADPAGAETAAAQ